MQKSDSDRQAGERVAIYPGTFDPVHYGHVDVVRRSANIFDRVIVAIYDRPAKALLFSVEERVDLFRRSVEGLPNVRVEPYSTLTVFYAKAVGACAIVRGLRATSDFDYEYQMTTMNRHLLPEIETVFIMASLEHVYLSSSLIKEVAAQGASLDRLVPDHVAKALKEKFARR